MLHDADALQVNLDASSVSKQLLVETWGQGMSEQSPRSIWSTEFYSILLHDIMPIKYRQLVYSIMIDYIIL